MRLVFMGTSNFAVPALRRLYQQGHDIVRVYCQPSRRAGRGYGWRPSDVQLEAERLGLPVHTPYKLKNNPVETNFLVDLKPDAVVVVAYGLILPHDILAVPVSGCLNVHASLLPRWRGASPIQAAILAGDKESGITIMQMDEGLDTGPILMQHSIPITSDMTAPILHDQLSELGATMICQTLANRPLPTPQPESGMTYAPVLTRQDGMINWSDSAPGIDRHIRAFNPWPGTFTTLNGLQVKIGSAIVEHSSGQNGQPGLVVDDKLSVTCGEGVLRLTRLQRPGKKMSAAQEFLHGTPIPAGSVFGS